ncbi:hypothetical protein ACH9L7_00890 [Haloferax sp. S1W]|uniref:DUF5789 family protein n=1 Tax=Haloferax sp. S1W TaxID=3377110 RepID=UPI0037C606F8
MNLGELFPYLQREFVYPVSTDHVLEQAGELEIDAPDHEDSETIESILTRLGSETYRSPNELYTTIIGSVTDDYIGRKFYDDRGADPAETWAAAGDEDRSF